MTIDINGITLFYKMSGSGLPLLLLHGNGEDHTIFDEIADKLKDHFTIYAIDSRNHGRSSRTKDCSYDVMAEDLSAFIKALGLGRVNILGFSDGAIISLILAMHDQECIGKMALLGPNLKPEDFTEKSYQYLKSVYEETGDPLFKLMLEQPDIELDDIKKIMVPTLVVGAEDDIYKPDTFEKIAAALPNADLKIVGGHDHGSYIVHNDMMYYDLIRHYLSEDKKIGH